MKKNINVAIADDQLLFRECLVDNLKKFQDLNIFMESANGAELLSKIAVSEIKPDVVLMDLNMPEMNGLETTLKLREILPEAKILILSVHGEVSYVARMVQQGVNGYLAKNSTLDEVYKAILTSHESGFYFNETVKFVLQSGVLNKRKKITNFNNEPFFTNREKEILQLICKEYTTQEIADKLFLSIRTIDGHRNHLLEKTGAKNTAGLVVFALRNNLIEMEM
jgi:DNA-binding NarL/FixJ family response regulator